jgi:predicted patatin/cPLA2 family phospholipase
VSQEAWDTEHPVLSLLRRRQAEGSLPGHRADGAKLGLAVEGGGMRGVVSASMLAAMDDLGFANCFDEVYACSSGAINAAYYLAGGTWYPLTIYFDDLSTREFVDMRRVFGKNPILNLSYAFDILDAIKPLDYEGVIKSPIPLNISITLIDEMQTVVANSFDSASDLKEALQASAWLPVAVSGTATYKGKRAVDGGVLTALPFRLALQGSCTHILLLSTHPMGRISAKPSLLARYTRRHLNNLRAGLGDGYLTALETKYQDQSMLASARNATEYSEPYIFDAAPLPGTPDVKRHELRPARLIEAAQRAYEVMYAMLRGKSSSAIRDGLIRAVPRFAVAERDFDDRRLIQVFDHGLREPVPWGIARDR